MQSEMYKMPRITIEEHLIRNLRLEFSEDSFFYIGRNRAYKQLKHLTNQDFGYDADAWEKWFDEADNPYPNAGIPYIESDEE